MIYLEPRSIYDQAIIRTENNVVVYCYYKLVDVLIDNAMKNDNTLTYDEAYDQVVDHIDYNIEGMRPNFTNWPILERDNDCVSEDRTPD